MTLPAQIFNFFTIQRQIKPSIKKITVKSENISASTNISPAPYCGLSKKEFKEPHGQSSTIPINKTPRIFKGKENVFFILKYKPADLNLMRE
jgi:hypothetical protein